jgi:hypothetical protein
MKEDISVAYMQFLQAEISRWQIWYLRGGNVKFPECHCWTCLGESRWEERKRSQFKSRDTAMCIITVFNTSFFDFTFRSVCDGRQNGAKCLHEALSEARYFRYQSPWNASWGFWNTFFKPDSSFWMVLTFQCRSSVSWRWWAFRANKQKQNDRKYWINSGTYPRRPSPNNPWARRLCRDQSWSFPANLKTENLKKLKKNVCQTGKNWLLFWRILRPRRWRR